MHIFVQIDKHSYSLEHMVLGNCEIEPGVFNLSMGQKCILYSTTIELVMVMAGGPFGLTWQWYYGCSVGILKDNLTMKKQSRIIKIQQSAWVAELLTLKKT